MDSSFLLICVGFCSLGMGGVKFILFFSGTCRFSCAESEPSQLPLYHPAGRVWVSSSRRHCPPSLSRAGMACPFLHSHCGQGGWLRIRQGNGGDSLERCSGFGKGPGNISLEVASLINCQCSAELGVFVCLFVLLFFSLPSPPLGIHETGFRLKP